MGKEALKAEISHVCDWDLSSISEVFIPKTELNSPRSKTNDPQQRVSPSPGSLPSLSLSLSHTHTQESQWTYPSLISLLKTP